MVNERKETFLGSTSPESDIGVEGPDLSEVVSVQ